MTRGLISPRSDQPRPLRLAVIGTDTGVGKTHLTVLLAGGLRALGLEDEENPFPTGTRSAGTHEGRVHDAGTFASLKS